MNLRVCKWVITTLNSYLVNENTSMVWIMLDELYIICMFRFSSYYGKERKIALVLG